MAEEHESIERQSFLELTRSIAGLPLDQAAAILESSASIASISLRAGIEFLRAAPAVARVLQPAELRAWGEMGRRLAMNDYETAVSFFIAGVEDLQTVPAELLPAIFTLSSRQMILSTSIGKETLHSLPQIVAEIADTDFMAAVLEVATEIARRSAKHSAEFLHNSTHVFEALKSFNDAEVTAAATALAGSFATRAGGIAADAWTAVPDALAELSPFDAKRLLTSANDFLERGGGAALHVLLAGGEILRRAREIFDDWIALLWVVAAHGNASLVAFVRSSPGFLRLLGAEINRDDAIELSRRVLTLTKEIGAVDAEAALACFRSSARALRTVSIEQFEAWARRGLSTSRADARARRSYFSLETRGSYEALHSGGAGLALDSVQHLLRLYVEALTGREVDVAPLAAVPDEARIGDGRTIHLPSLVNEFGEDDLDFKLYKVLAAHAAGQIEFGTYERELGVVYRAIAELYTNADARDAFAIADQLLHISESEEDTDYTDPDADYRDVIKLFPLPQLARRIFGTLENGRIDRRLRLTYRGLRRDLDLIREHLGRSRPRINELPGSLVPFELLFQITMLGGARDDARQLYGQIVSEIETIVGDYLSAQNTTVADTLMATTRVYELFKSVTPLDDSVQQVEAPEDQTEAEDESALTERMKQQQTQQMPQRRDARELFNAWNDPSPEGEPDELTGADAWSEGESPEQMLSEGEVAYNYDEWDRELTDHRLGWCRVIEKRVKHGDRSFVEQTRERHKGVISSIRHQFQLMKPENLTRVANEVDGEEFDLNAVIDYVIDRRADGQQSERIYTKRLRRRRDVAVSFLLDQSSSTARTIGRHPLQPYTRPGRRIIEIEKEGLVLMSEALEAVGDTYSINGFTSEGRRNVKFYVVKDFNEKYNDEVKQRIGGINYQNNTRLGAAIRHATAKLAKQDARTRLLIVLSDGRPYDHDYGDARYAREDTREALRQAKNEGITPFCITIDRESEAELKDLYGEIGYTIIDDVLSLPERLPGIYRRLTT
ncbi:MAG: VWA domain-containing protein [Acidobacteria bacterium]|nr:VWA domain-containing protein [Acidobacteriota bacterium]MCA1627263.1 VWA domain-containing protein [Acidobacteriota bacterium]